jgi:hypothetical protein
VFNAGIQGNSSQGPVSCFKLHFETVVIIVTLPMSKTAFAAIEDKYIFSVATTARVDRENVKILNINEISTRFSRFVTGRLLLSAAVQVQTSILIEIGQQTNIKDQTVLNINLNKNGLPSSTLQIFDSSQVVSTTPAPVVGGSGSGSNAATLPSQTAEAASASSKAEVPIGPIVGGTVGFAFLLTCLYLVRRHYKVCFFLFLLY